MSLLLALKAASFLVFIILLIYGSLRAGKKLLIERNHQSRLIKVLEHKRIDHKQTLMLISIAESSFLIITSPQAIAVTAVPLVKEECALSKSFSANTIESRME